MTAERPLDGWQRYRNTYEKTPTPDVMRAILLDDRNRELEPVQAAALAWLDQRSEQMQDIELLQSIVSDEVAESFGLVGRSKTDVLRHALSIASYDAEVYAHLWARESAWIEEQAATLHEESLADLIIPPDNVRRLEQISEHLGAAQKDKAREALESIASARAALARIWPKDGRMPSIVWAFATDSKEQLAVIDLLTWTGAEGWSRVHASDAEPPTADDQRIIAAERLLGDERIRRIDGWLAGTARGPVVLGRRKDGRPLAKPAGGFSVRPPAFLLLRLVEIWAFLFGEEVPLHDPRSKAAVGESSNAVASIAFIVQSLSALQMPNARSNKQDELREIDGEELRAFFSELKSKRPRLLWESVPSLAMLGFAIDLASDS